jgi:hypothetical protein
MNLKGNKSHQLRLLRMPCRHRRRSTVGRLSSAFYKRLTGGATVHLQDMDWISGGIKMGSLEEESFLLW